jgi:hypothetical protein
VVSQRHLRWSHRCPTRFPATLDHWSSDLFPRILSGTPLLSQLTSRRGVGASWVPKSGKWILGSGQSYWLRSEEFRIVTGHLYYTWNWMDVLSFHILSLFCRFSSRFAYKFWPEESPLIIPGRYSQMPWHVSGVNGWHEDFHLVVACGDLAFCMMAYDTGTWWHGWCQKLFVGLRGRWQVKIRMDI